MRDHQADRSRAWQLPDRLCGVGPGWHPLLLHTQLRAWDANYRVEDLKEKLGALRVHIATASGPSDPEIRDLIRSAENESATVCEFCGATGRRRGDTPHGWIKAVCAVRHAAAVAPHPHDRQRCRAPPQALTPLRFRAAESAAGTVAPPGVAERNQLAPGRRGAAGCRSGRVRR